MADLNPPQNTPEITPKESLERDLANKIEVMPQHPEVMPQTPEQPGRTPEQVQPEVKYGRRAQDEPLHIKKEGHEDVAGKIEAVKSTEMLGAKTTTEITMANEVSRMPQTKVAAEGEGEKAETAFQKGKISPNFFSKIVIMLRRIFGQGKGSQAAETQQPTGSLTSGNNNDIV